MKGKHIYEKYPAYTTDHFLLRLVEERDAEDLLQCYSDAAAVRLMNSDNCTGDFHLGTLHGMKVCIQQWRAEYERSFYVRFSVVEVRNRKAIGTIEMFDKTAEVGVLRMDLCTAYERQDYIVELLTLSVENFYEAFGVQHIVTKAIPAAVERIAALHACGFTLTEREVNGPYGDYYIR